MNIVPVGVSAAQAAQQLQPREPHLLQAAAAPEHGKPVDTVEISPGRANRSAMQRDNAVKTVSMQAQMLRRMAERIIKEQYAKGNHWYMLMYGNKAVQLDPSLRPETTMIEITPQERQVVANAVEYFSPAQTSRRILDTAEDIAGPDTLSRQPVVTEAFRSAVREAFVNVQNEVGGVLPELSQLTYEAAMQGFDAWTDAARQAAL
ncbi:MAG: hypothetical protein LBH95_00800 [Oscillospiraceae bacterium]|jgi:hypothetical protein|nr:hypothetical protein [Oscillospiraceae bacterium]